MSCVSVNSFATRHLLKVVKWRPWDTKIVITLRQKGFSKSLLLFWSLYDLKSAGSAFKVLMFIGSLTSLEFWEQTNRQTDWHYDYSNPLLCLHRWGLITCIYLELFCIDYYYTICLEETDVLNQYLQPLTELNFSFLLSLHLFSCFYENTITRWK